MRPQPCISASHTRARQQGAEPLSGDQSSCANATMPGGGSQRASVDGGQRVPRHEPPVIGGEGWR
eukprot:13034960-Alexandrium_andersonii.AAC.1